MPWYVYEENEQLKKLLCSTRKNIERKKIQFAQSKINIGLKRKKNCDDDLAMCGEEIKKKFLYPYPMPITDPTHLLEVSVFLFRVSQNMSSYYVPVLSSTYATAYCRYFSKLF